MPNSRAISFSVEENPNFDLYGSEKCLLATAAYRSAHFHSLLYRKQNSSQFSTLLYTYNNYKYITNHK